MCVHEYEFAMANIKKLVSTPMRKYNTCMSDLVTHVDGEKSHSSLLKRVHIDSSLLSSFVVAGVIALIVRFFVAAPYIVSGPSMEPNYQDFNYLLVDRLSYRVHTPERGDVIVFDLPQNHERALIKRVIGLPGDTVSLSGPKPTVTITNATHPNGIVLDEPYLDPADYGGTSDARYTLGPDQYFVLGDNRKVSADSRLWGILPSNDIVGRVLLRLYPLSEISVYPSTARYGV